MVNILIINIATDGVIELIKKNFDIMIGPKKVITDIIKHKTLVLACAPPAAILKAPYTMREVITGFKTPSIRDDMRKIISKKVL